MAAAQRAWSTGMRTSIQGMKAAVAVVASNTSTQQILAPQIVRMRTLSTNLRRFSDTWSSAPVQAVPRTRAQLVLFVTDFASLLNALTPQLDRLGARLSYLPGCSIGTSEEEVFWELWSFLVSSCSAFDSAMTTCPGILSEEQPLFYTRLYAAFCTVLTWLLPMSRTTAWQAMGAENGIRQRNRDLMVILSQPVGCLVQNFSSHSPNVLSKLATLPHNLLPLLCCIVSEQFCSTASVLPHTAPGPSNASSLSAATATAAATSATTYTQGLQSRPHSFTTSLNDLFFLVTASADCLACNMIGHTGQLSCLTAPSVPQLLKLIIIKLADQKCPASQFVSSVTNRMSCLLHSSITQPQPFSSTGLVRTLCSHGGLVSLPLHFNPFKSQTALETDVRLLHALSKHMQRDASLTERCFDAQAMVLRSWEHAGGVVDDAPVAAVAMMVKSVIGLAKQCQAHVLLALCATQQQQVHGVRVMHDGCEQRERQTGQQQQQRRLLMSSSSVAAALDVETMQAVQELICKVSKFRVYTPGGGTAPKICPEFLTLDAWCGMHGWTAAIEMLKRGKYRPASAIQVGNVIILSMDSLILARGRTQTGAALLACISLAATARKLVWPYVQRSAPEACIGLRAGQLNEGLREGRWQVDQAELLSYVQGSELIPGMLEAIILLDMHSLSGVVSGNTCSSGSSRMKGHAIAHLHSQSDCMGPGMPASSNISPTFLIHQLLATSLVTFIQVSLWRLECEETGANIRKGHFPPWCMDIIAMGKQLKHPHLQALMKSLIGKSVDSAPRSSSEVGEVCERYAVANFHGWLLPGCCNLGCTNLDGVSELALKTQLCSGCRRARYCCLGCQKAAWLRGGHRKVCDRK